MEGVEPSTSGFVVRRSDPIELHGLVGEVGSSEGRSRTCNRRLNRAPHCQLCYLEMKQGCGQDARVTRRVRELNPQGGPGGGRSTVFGTAAVANRLDPPNVPRQSPGEETIAARS